MVKSNISIQPVVISFLNLPMSHRNDYEFQHIYGIIPKGTNDLDPYLTILVNEIMQINEKIYAYDAATEEVFKVSLQCFIYETNQYV